MTGYTNDVPWLLILVVAYAVVAVRRRDYYVVVREFRIVEAHEFGKGKKIEARYTHHFDDYSAANAFFNLHESYAVNLNYENQQQINYVYAVPALTAKGANAKMAKKSHHEARLLLETPFSTLAALKRHWDQERKARVEI